MKKIIIISLLMVCGLSTNSVFAMDWLFGKRVTEEQRRQSQFEEMDKERDRVSQDVIDATIRLVDSVVKGNPVHLNGDLLAVKALEVIVRRSLAHAACSELTDKSSADDKWQCDANIKEFYKAARIAREAAQDIKDNPSRSILHNIYF